ncbi:hypothetical protein IWW34DRAFT_882203 [Fusarium oxysporum f. sp. albedinis]|nr:hypothetical protein IWW34DRAFT_882203 [Fusarium oxysporum f. sp. albedinis]KAK2480753.1 hypothetical protein H9L39_06392 [Fusarium oxysporum f. sp. albedinis]
MAQPTEIDALPPIEDTEIIWPDDIPDAPEFQDEDEPRTPMNLETEPDTRDWTEILAEQVARVPAFQLECIKRNEEHHYSHLPNSEIDWELPGKEICRVVGLSCYGRVYVSSYALGQHLKTKKHRNYDESIGRQFPVPKRMSDVQVSLSPKKPKLRHTISIEQLMSDDLVLQDKPFDEASEYPSSFNYPPWLVIPDSRETSEDEEMLPSPANELRPVLKHTVEKTTGENLVLEDKSFEEASKMPLSFYYPPWGVVQDSDEDSENEPYVNAV